MYAVTFMSPATLHEEPHIHVLGHITCFIVHSWAWVHYMPSEAFII